jgi:hypothetical protein
MVKTGQDWRIPDRPTSCLTGSLVHGSHLIDSILTIHRKTIKTKKEIRMARKTSQDGNKNPCRQGFTI